MESLIAILLLGIMFTGGMAFYYQANALYYGGLHMRQATGLANSRMEVCKNAGYVNLDTRSGSDYNNCINSGPVNVGAVSFTPTVTVGSSSNNLVPVKVQFDWTEPSSGSRSISLQTYVGQ